MSTTIESNPRFAEGKQYREYVKAVYEAAGVKSLDADPDAHKTGTHGAVGGIRRKI